MKEKNFKKYLPLMTFLTVLIIFMVCKASVLNIVWAGVSADEKGAWVETDLPEGAVQVIEASSQAEILRYSYFLIALIIIGFTTFLFIGKKKGILIPSKKGVLMGVTASFLLQGVHELLHGLAFSPGSTVYIGAIKENFSMYATSTDPMDFFTCIIYYMLPVFVLGFVPLLFFIFTKKKEGVLCSFFYSFAWIGFIQTSPDWIGLFPILVQVPHDAIIQMSGWHTYWYFM